ncbi:MAG: hypothetical protein KAH98_02525 [Dehalococcoidia bacterium]|nr:hypothetical protein [Dehalococcoidia bacterium]
MTVLKVFYVLAMGALLTMLVAFGISTFYEAPQFEPPESPRPPVGWVWPVYPDQIPEDQDWTEEEQEYWEAHQDWMEEEQEYRENNRDAMKVYHRNVLFIAYPFGLLFIVLGLVLPPRLDIIKTGLLLGGVVTIMYAVLQGFDGMSNALRFGAIAISLAVLVFLGYRTLIERRQPKNSKITGKEDVENQ